MATVPLGLIGIVLALLLANRPLGFVAILGILALVGMIARNAVILIDQIETERAQGRDIWDAVVEATLSRFRPIMLTAVSTVLGLIPIAPTVFWGPMAFAIMGGLFVATLLTLLVLPVFYITLYRAKQPARRRWPPSARSFSLRDKAAGKGEEKQAMKRQIDSRPRDPRRDDMRACDAWRGPSNHSIRRRVPGGANGGRRGSRKRGAGRGELSQHPLCGAAGRRIALEPATASGALERR